MKARRQDAYRHDRQNDTHTCSQETAVNQPVRRGRQNYPASNYITEPITKNRKKDESVRLPPHKIARLGLGYCPEERGIYASLSCEENLLLPPVVGNRGMSLEEIYELFPNLAERRASPGTKLSGGEQQMLAMARILRTGARLLLLDEISEGLAPVIVETLGRVIGKLKAMGLTIVLVEQNYHFAAPIADRLLVIEQGRVVAEFSQNDLVMHADDINRYLGV